MLEEGGNQIEELGIEMGFSDILCFVDLTLESCQYFT